MIQFDQYFVSYAQKVHNLQCFTETHCQAVNNLTNLFQMGWNHQLGIDVSENSAISPQMIHFF